MKKAIIMDLDGTLVDSPLVSPDIYHQIDWEAFNEENIACRSFSWAEKMVEVYHGAGYEIVFMTARDGSERTRAATLEWLARHFSFPVENLFMRAPGDFRKDSLVKAELFWTHVHGRFQVEFAVDDKLSNCRVFRDFGIPSLCCAEKE